MVHYGKHIIDPETGLCEICDRGAIHDQQHGKRTARQFLYSNQDGKFTYRPLDPNNDPRHPLDETPSPRHARKPIHHEPIPRPIALEEPVVQRKIPRHDHSPLDDIHNPRSGRFTTFYYVDSNGQMVPRAEGPADEPRRRHLVQNQSSPNSNRSSHRRAQTPPPPASETWRSRPPRQVNSDTKIIHQNRRPKPEEVFSNHSPRKAEMFHIERPHHDTRFPTISSRVQEAEHPRKQRQLEPVERKHHVEPQPHVPRKVHKRLPDNANGHNLRLVRKVEKIYPPPGHHQSAPHLPHRNQNPSLYYLRSKDEY